MPNKVATFEKVSFDNFKESIKDVGYLRDEDIREIYDSIKLPKRATTGSAGHDFYLPYGFRLEPGETQKVPTGIRCKIEDGWVLNIYPRSSLGFKYRIQLDNTVGIIDSDYYNSDNEGHIFVKITNDKKSRDRTSYEDKTAVLYAGDAFCQGIFLPFGVADEEEITETRNGGFGSTDK